MIGISWPLNTLDQGYSIISGKGPYTNVKIFRGPVTPIKSCKCDMPWIVITKTQHDNIIVLHIRGVTRRCNSPGAESLLGRRKVQKCHKHFLQYSKLASERSQVRTCFLPRAPTNLVTPLYIYVYKSGKSIYIHERMLSALFIVLLVGVIAPSAFWQLLKFLFQSSDCE